jgi:hypothetical protein
MHTFYTLPPDKLQVQCDPGLYFFISQGCLHVDSIDDKEEMMIMDVCKPPSLESETPCLRPKQGPSLKKNTPFSITTF